MRELSHIFLQCPFVKQIWSESIQTLEQACVWQGQNIEQAWRNWVSNPTNNSIKALPLLINWGAWLARNASISNAHSSIPEHIVAEGLSILSHFPQGKDHNPVRPVVEELVDHSRPWAYFDGASQNDSLVCGGGLSSMCLPLTLSTIKWD